MQIWFIVRTLHINLVRKLTRQYCLLSVYSQTSCIKVVSSIMQASTMSALCSHTGLSKKYDETLALSNPSMTNSSMVQMHRTSVGYQRFISERIGRNTMVAESYVYVMALSNTLRKGYAPHLRARSVRNVGVLLLIGTGRGWYLGIGWHQMKLIARRD